MVKVVTYEKGELEQDVWFDDRLGEVWTGDTYISVCTSVHISIKLSYHETHQNVQDITMHFLGLLMIEFIVYCSLQCAMICTASKIFFCHTFTVSTSVKLFSLVQFCILYHCIRNTSRHFLEVD